MSTLLRAARRALPLALLCACSPERRPANVLLLSLDSVRADHEGTEIVPRPGAEPVRTAPAFDRLAREGAVFESAVSTTSWTLPAHMALLTGLDDDLHGVIDNAVSLDPALVTLAELMQASGRRTAGFYSGPYLDPVFGFGQGFDGYVNCGSSLPTDVFDSRELGRWREVHQLSHETVTSPELYRRAAAWIRERAAAREPFFAFVHWWDPHYDYRAPAEHERLFDTGYRGDWTGVRGDHKRPDVQPADVAHVRALYCAEIRYTDDHVGRLLDLLDELDLARDTLVVLTSDHGEEFYERDRWGHQRTLYDEVLAIPLALRFPGRVPAGVRPRGQARIQDVYATVADLVGVAPPPYVTAVSLRPLWEDPAAEGAAQPLRLLVPHVGIDLVGLRTRDAKVLWERSTGSGTFFNLERDPGEKHPRAFGERELERADHPVIAGLARLLEEQPARRAALPRTEGHAPVELDAAQRFELGALGYLGDEDDAPTAVPRPEPVTGSGDSPRR